jgi:hypothetical protein
MKSRFTVARIVGLLAITACHPAVSPEVQQHFQGRSLFTCCNVHYESDDINDANYWTGKTLPLGTPVRVEKVTSDSVTFFAGDAKLTLAHAYGKDQESFQQYFDKVLIASDPKPHVAAYPPAVRRAIEESKVEKGMTKEQVIASLGYPPTHHTASTQEREWTYWYNRWLTFKVVFDDAGKVADVVGRPAPTAETPIANADAPPAPASKAPAKKHKKK